MVNAVESKITESINSALTSVINDREDYYKKILFQASAM